MNTKALGGRMRNLNSALMAQFSKKKPDSKQQELAVKQAVDQSSLDTVSSLVKAKAPKVKGRKGS